jgi:hypothetical protein
MADNTKDKVAASKSIGGLIGATGKTITSINAHIHGNVTVIELGYSGGPQYIKVRHGNVEFGGTHEWNTGTQIL